MELYNNYNDTLRQRFGGRVQKISINAGFTCPNRDGRKGVGGCIFCNNQTFFPDYCMPKKSVEQQMREGMEFFARYEGQYYLAYFQAYTNTYADLDTLRALYESVLDIENVVGIVIATRPDCVDGKLLDYLAELNRRCYVMVEYGVESTCDETLRRINRGHGYDECVWAIKATAQRSIAVGAHLILGLPGEGRDMVAVHAENISKLPIDMVKLHQLQIVEGSVLGKMWHDGVADVTVYELDDYIEDCIRFLEYLRPEIGIERFVSQTPKELLIAPDWGVKNYEFVDKLRKRMRTENRFQGSLCV